ncbi:cysteine desulfurase [Thalassospiraceae bacterium LMO-SO8]|nr:cysteine desulfurase [Alphaproteobacteria bacterium LMO-S08]WND76769.1 cysteine desulfurase [Thalassospiraceae bacterium LMO-SO8]
MPVLSLRDQFPSLASGLAGTYLDNAAMTQIAGPVLARMAAFETGGRANVKRGIYPLATQATAAFEGARAALARYLGAGNPNEVVFTSGATAAINLVAQGFGAGLAAGDEIIIGEAEHHANIVPWQMLRDRAGVVLKVLPVDDAGHPRLDALDDLMTARTRLITVTHASNVTGAVTDVAAICDKARGKGVRVLVDGAQMAAHGPVDVVALGCDFYVVTGHKMFGPTGVGVLWARAEVLDGMTPFMGGGEMIRRVTFAETTYAPPPHRFEAGTPPVTQAVGLGAAADMLLGLDWPEIRAQEQVLFGILMERLAALGRVTVIGPGGNARRLPILSFTVTDAHPHDICELMGARGIALRGGHHCAQPLMDRFGIEATTRASLALYNVQGDIDAFTDALDETLKVLA